MKALDDMDYLDIADELIRAKYPDAVIREKDIKFSGINPQLKDGIAGAIRRRIGQAYSQLNAELNFIADATRHGRDRTDFPATDELKESLELPRMQAVLKTVQDYFKTRKDELVNQKNGTANPPKREPVTIPENHLNIVRDELIKMNLLTDRGENKGLKPMVAALLPELANRYNTTQQEVLDQIKDRWKLEKGETKNYKPSDNKKIKGSNSEKAREIISKIPS